MTRLDELPGDFDMADRLRSCESLVLDIYNRDFFVCRQGARTTTVQGTKVTTQQRLDGTRLHVELDYLDCGTRDVFDWQVFTVDAIRELAGDVGLSLLVACSGFDAGVAVHEGDPRMQLVFEKR